MRSYCSTDLYDKCVLNLFHSINFLGNCRSEKNNTNEHFCKIHHYLFFLSQISSYLKDVDI
jgi:hypothetical protein